MLFVLDPGIKSESLMVKLVKQVKQTGSSLGLDMLSLSPVTSIANAGRKAGQ